MHSEDDQIVPYVVAGPLSAKLLKSGTSKTYRGFPRGMPTTEAETINADLLTFLQSSPPRPPASAAVENFWTQWNRSAMFLKNS